MDENIKRDMNLEDTLAEIRQRERRFAREAFPPNDTWIRDNRLLAVREYYAAGRLMLKVSDVVCDDSEGLHDFGHYPDKLPDDLDQDYVPDDEVNIELQWKQQGGCKPKDGKAWLTPRMERNAKRTTDHYERLEAKAPLHCSSCHCSLDHDAVKSGKCGTCETPWKPLT